jgi:hypothetical protein
MKTSHTFNVHFWLKKTSARKDGTTPIYARIRLDGIPADVSTKQSIPSEHWCQKACRVNPKVKDARIVNDCLEDIHSDIKAPFQELKEEGRCITSQAIKMRYSGEDSPLKSLKDLLKYHRKNELKKLAKGTAKNYGTTEK